MTSEKRKTKRCGNGEGSIFQRADGRWTATNSIGFDAGTGKRQRTLRNAGLTYRSFHNLRHTYATLALAAGVPVNIVSAVLGHAMPSSAQPQCSASMPNRLAANRSVQFWYANPHL